MSDVLTDERRLDLLNEQARELLQMPDGWRWYEWHCLPEKGPTQVMRIKGAVVPIHESGKNAGTPNWKGRDKDTERELYITPQQQKDWLARWEQQTGKCSTCQGTAQEYASWHYIEGTKYRPCTKCGATGKSKHVQ